MSCRLVSPAYGCCPGFELRRQGLGGCDQPDETGQLVTVAGSTLNRSFLTSPFVYLEVVPKAIFHKKRIERSFYERYFSNATWYRDVASIEAVARAEATGAGLGAMDALHLAAAHLARSDEFITTEKPLKAIHRSKTVRVVYLFD